MASLEGEAPIKQCVIILEKKVRNLEKRKVKLDGYKSKAKEGAVLDKDQQEAVSKYDQVVQNLEFSKELLKQFHQINNETEKVLRKQAKRDKIEKQNSDISRLKEVLKLQVALKTLSDSEAREGFVSGKCSVNALSEDQLKILDDFHNLVTLSKNLEQSYGQQCSGAAEHLYLLLEKSEKAVLGEVTYKEVAQLIDSITGGCYFESGLLLENVEVKEESPVKDTNSVERDADEEPQPLLNGNSVAVETVCITSNGFEVSEVLPEAIPTLRTELSESPVVENGTPFQNAESMHSQQLQQSINIPVSELQSAAVVDHQSTAVPQGVMMGGHWANSEPLVQSQLVRRAPFGTPLAAQYFGTSTFDGQRPLRDIVSSMQGSYNFLQESLIEGSENQNNVNNSSIVNAPADAVVSSNSPSSLQPQIIDHHHHLQQDQHQLPMATIAGSQAGGYPVYHGRLHPPHLLHHHHEGQTLGMSTSVPGDVYYTQQQIYQRIPTNVYERNNQQNIHDVMEVKQHQQIPSNISPPSSIAYPSYHSMQRPEDSESECQISGFMMGSVPNVSAYQQQQQPQQQLENEKGSYTMNPNADIFHSGFHATSQADVSLANEVQVEQPQNGSSGQSHESKDVGSKTFAQTASAGKSYQEFTNTQNRRGPKPGSQYQRHPNRQQFVNRQGNAIPYNNTNNPTRGGNVSYGGGAKFGGPGGGARPPCQGNSFYERNEHYHS